MNDYKTLINDFDLEIWKEDNSIENGSSISVLMEYNNKKYYGWQIHILLT